MSDPGARSCRHDDKAHRSRLQPIVALTDSLQQTVGQTIVTSEEFCEGPTARNQMVVPPERPSLAIVQRRLFRVVALASVLGLVLGCSCEELRVVDERARSSSAEWGDNTDGGRGGSILRVTSLAARGEGSLRAAVEAGGRRIVVFEVGGIIDLAGGRITVREPFLTIAGQTAPSPGITLIRGGLRVETHDVVVQHLRVRPGEAGHEKESGWEVDGITTSGPDAHDIVIDHCSISWATDENLTASGPRFQGSNPGEWRRGTSRRITFSHNIVAEGLWPTTTSMVARSNKELSWSARLTYIIKNSKQKVQALEPGSTRH